jgi:hypothetical protein
MITIKTTPAFDTWLSGIKDRVKIAETIEE